MSNYVKMSNILSKSFTADKIKEMQDNAKKTMYTTLCISNAKHGETTHIKGIGCLKCKEEAEAKELNVKYRWDFNPPYKYVKANISQYIAETEHQQKAKSIFSALCANPERFNNAMTKGLNLWIYGNSGAGKTHLSIAFLNYCFNQKNLNVAYININELFASIKATYKSNDDDVVESKEKLMKRFIYADILVVDELGMSELSDHDHELLYQMIDERQSKKPHKITIYISNIHFDEWDQVVGTRILSRMQENYYKLIIAGKDRRNNELDDSFFGM